MSYKSCADRTFTLFLPAHYYYNLRKYLHWLRYLLERLGREDTLFIWNMAFKNQKDELLDNIISNDWIPIGSESFGVGIRPIQTQIEKQTGNEEASLENERKEFGRLLTRLFSPAFEGVSFEDAGQLIKNITPFSTLLEYYPNLQVKREISAYEAIHLFQHGIACLVETLIDQHGKRGELIAYDALLAEVEINPPNQMTISEFFKKRLASFLASAQSNDIFSAALERNIINTSDQEIRWNVIECEFSRYFREKHPRVGYLIACSTDQKIYQSFNPSIRLQLTSSLMEGCDMCRYRLYAVKE